MLLIHITSLMISFHFSHINPFPHNILFPTYHFFCSRFQLSRGFLTTGMNTRIIFAWYEKNSNLAWMTAYFAALSFIVFFFPFLPLRSMPSVVYFPYHNRKRKEWTSPPKNFLICFSSDLLKCLKSHGGWFHQKRLNH